jgi:signal transduction histidine kinase
VAHDFNNLLSIIKGSVQIIEDHLDDPVKVQRRLDRIKTMVEQGTRVVQAMLGFSRSSQDRLVPADLNEVVRDTLLLLGERGRNTAHIEFEAQAGLPPVPMIRDLVQQILLNLLFNALEAVGENGTILLQTGRTKDLPPGLVLQPAAAAEYCFVVVRDSGCGIAPEHLPRIFEPFFTTKALSSRRGTGLGLTMVYEMTKRLGGGLAVESEPGRGSQFTLLLPLLPLDGMRGQESSHDAGVAAVPVPPGQQGGPDRRAM